MAGPPISTRLSNSSMQWNRSETIALAKPTCTQCRGLGLRAGSKGKKYACNCVFRAIFRACYARFRECANGVGRLSTISLDWCSEGAARKRFYGRKPEEYVADFCLVSRRRLSEDDHEIFRYHYLLGADWKICCDRLKIDRETFFYRNYAIQQMLGRAFRELQPYSLYPLDEYFLGVARKPVTSCRKTGTAGITNARKEGLPRIA